MRKFRWLPSLGAAVALLMLSFIAHGQAPSSISVGAPDTLPAVDGLNAKLDAVGGAWWDSNRSSGFYGASGSFSLPLAHRWGAQLDAAVGSDNGVADIGGAGHLFWRDPAVGLLGAYVSYAGRVDSLGTNAVHMAGEGQYYWNRWIFSAAVGVEIVNSTASVPGWESVQTRFFDAVTAAYYVTDNLQLWAGHRYAYGANALALGLESAVALGGGRMASLFSDALFAEGGGKGVRGGVRIYFGQRDKTLIERHRQDDPPAAIQAGGCGFGFHRGANGQCMANRPGRNATPAPAHPGCWRNEWGELRCQ